MLFKINGQSEILSPLNNYKNRAQKKNITDSIIEFDAQKIQSKEFEKKLLLGAINDMEQEQEKEAQRKNHVQENSTRTLNEDGSYTDTIKYKNGTEKSITTYQDGSFDEIYKSKNGLSYTRIKRFDSKDDYTEIYQDSSGFCGKETFVKLADGTSISTNEFSNGKKYTETYKKNPDGGFTRKLVNSDGTGYTETQAYNADGTSSYSIENEDGSSNTIIYNLDGSYAEILVDSNGNKTITEYK